MEATTLLEKSVSSGVSFGDKTLFALRSQVVSFDLPTQSVENDRPYHCKYTARIRSCAHTTNTRDVYIDGISLRGSSADW